MVVAGCATSPGASAPMASTPSPAIPHPSGHRPVLIVPGWALGCENGPTTEWQDWLDAFSSAGYAPGEVEVFQGSRCIPNEQSAVAVGAAVDSLLDRTGQAKVDIIAHSMGALAARWCQKFGDCRDKVANLITLSGANHGTIWANFCALQFWSQACPDMTPDSAMLTALNSGDETPGDTHFETFVSICELVILPKTSPMLAGADNHDVTDRCVQHDQWKQDQPTIHQVADELSGRRGTLAGNTRG
jgi:triacylglycerol lipase